MIKKKEAIMKLLHYRILSGRRDSNSRPPAPKAGILTGLNYIPHTSFSKASAKVLLFFDMTKYFGKKMQKKCYFLNFCRFQTQKWVFFALFTKKKYKIKVDEVAIKIPAKISKAKCWDK